MPGCLLELISSSSWKSTAPLWLLRREGHFSKTLLFYWVLWLKHSHCCRSGSFLLQLVRENWWKFYKLSEGKVSTEFSCIKTFCRPNVKLCGVQLEQCKMKLYFISHLFCSIAFKITLIILLKGWRTENHTVVMNMQWLESKRVVNSSKMLKIERVNDSNINKLK